MLRKLFLVLTLAFALSGAASAADTKLTALPQGTCAALYYGEESAASSKYNGCLVHNVKDFGAVGDDTHDDTTAIQNAVNWQTTTCFRGTIYFPDGIYKVTGTITLPSTIGAECSITLQGTGMASEIHASGFTGYIFQRLSFDGTCYPAHTGLFTIQDLNFVAASGAGIGGIKIQGIEVVVTQRLEMVGLSNAIYIGVSNFNWAVRDVEIKGGTGVGPPVTGTIGIMNGAVSAERICGAGPTQGVQIDNVTITNYDECQRHSGSAFIKNARCESSNTGYNFGVDPAGSTWNMTVDADGLGIEQVGSGIIGSWSGPLRNVNITSDGAGCCTVGILAHNLTNVLFENLNIIGPYTTGSIVADNVGSQANWLNVKFARSLTEQALFTGSISGTTLTVSAITQTSIRVGETISGANGTSVAANTTVTALGTGTGGTGTYTVNNSQTVSSGAMTGNVPWTLPGAGFRAGILFEQSNNQSYPLTFGDLPGQSGSNVPYPQQSRQYVISDAATGNCSDSACNWGANVTGGGGALTRTVIYNGANWTVTAK